MTQALAPLLTRAMQPIVDAVGFDAAITLVAVFGGTRPTLPARPGADDAISAVIGVDKAEQLVQRVGPGPLDVPRCLNWLAARRNEEICARYLAGETQTELARRFRLTERHIRRVVQASIDEGDIA